jgi:hypothetical protein
VSLFVYFAEGKPFVAGNPLGAFLAVEDRSNGPINVMNQAQKSHKRLGL